MELHTRSFWPLRRRLKLPVHAQRLWRQPAGFRTAQPWFPGALRRVGRLALLLGFPLSGLVGCGSDLAGVQPAPDPSALYWALVFDQHAVTLDTLSGYDTLRLHASARTSRGDTLAGLGTVTYRSTDLSLVRVSTDGLLQAVKPITALPVIATLTVGELTHADTVFVTVTANSTPPSPLVTFSLQPALGDSARWSVPDGTFDWYEPRFVPAQMLDGTGTPIPGAGVDYRSSDPTVAEIDRQTGQLHAHQAGHVVLSASATAYGVTKRDTLAFTITAPLFAIIQPDHPFLGTNAWSFSPQDITIEAGGEVAWFNQYTYDPAAGYVFETLLDVMFNDPTNVAPGVLLCGEACSAGNLPAFGAIDLNAGILDFVRSRSFPIVGTYPYHSSLLQASGTIHVVHTP